VSPSPESPRLFIPGPTDVDAEVLREMSRAPIGHRGPQIEALIAEVEEGLQALLGTREPVLLFTSAATAVMEAAILNTVGENGVLHLRCGAFGDKWEKISRSLGRSTSSCEVEWGRGFTPELVADELRRGDYDAVCLTHNETSTGVLNPLREIASVVREAGDTLLLVDAVSAMSAVEVDFDDWGVDVLLAGVQKAFALPPGLAVAAVSSRVYERAEKLPNRGTYLDFLSYRRLLLKNQTPSTPSTAHLYALRRQLQRIHEEGRSARARRHQQMGIQTREWTRGRFRMFADEAFASPTVSCIQVPEGFDVADLKQRALQQGFALGSGYGVLKPTTFRIGHMGEHDSDSLEALLSTLDQILDGPKDGG